MRSYESATLKHCLNDKDFQLEYMMKHGNLNCFEVDLENTISYCFNSDFNPFLDEPYQDVSWLKIKGLKKLVNLDDIFDCWQQDLWDNAREE